MVLPIVRRTDDHALADLPEGIESALTELAIAHDYARDARRNAWQFAVEISRMIELGLTGSDLRWLVEKGYAVHAREITKIGDADRKFAFGLNTAFSSETRFLLTDAGLTLAAGCKSVPTLLRFSSPDGSKGENATCVPRWCGGDGTLYMGSQIVKRFKRPSPNQEVILATFEEEGWPDRIDDPLPQVNGIDPKRRLHDSIKWLNRNQSTRLLRFSGDGSGEGVRWQPLVADTLPISNGMPIRIRAAA
jgi:hypothetical protein